MRLPEGRAIRVLVVDDSVVIRRLVTHALEEDPALEVVGVAQDGAVALERIRQLDPDVVTLDIEMPVMDGLEALRRLRRLRPDLRVIMFSTLTERGAEATLDALTLGADDYVTKAANAGSLDRSIERLRSDLIPKIKQFFDSGERQKEATPPVVAARAAQRTEHSLPAGRAVVIGVSTGGPNALATVVPMFPPNFPWPILIVQHMPPLFTKLLADRLNTLTRLQVEEASAGSAVQAGRILIAPGDFHLCVRTNGEKVFAALNQDAPENSCRPSVDVLFRSAADVYGGGVVAAILTGMGNDGVHGAAVLRKRGARIIAQDEASCVVWGMPGGVVKAGLADAVVDLKCVVPEILKQL
jgi:two-component system chemotaxis response regulator CheB